MPEPEGDLIPREIAERRGMTYHLNSKGFVCEAKDTGVFLIDRLFARNLIDQDHHFFGAQMITMHKALTRDTGCKVGLLNVKSEPGDTAATGEQKFAIEPEDYLFVLRGITNPHYKTVVRVTCHEEAHESDCRNFRAESYGYAFDQLGRAGGNPVSVQVSLLC